MATKKQPGKHGPATWADFPPSGLGLRPPDGKGVVLFVAPETSGADEVPKVVAKWHAAAKPGTKWSLALAVPPSTPRRTIKAPTPPSATPAFITLREYALIARCHYSKAVRAARSGNIPAIKEGATWLVPASYLESLQAEAFARFAAATSSPEPEAPRHDAVADTKAAVREHVRRQRS